MRSSVAPNTELWLKDWVETEGQIMVAATMERPDGSRCDLWYRVPADLKPALTRHADPFVAGILFGVMHTGGRLLVHGDVSPSLLRNMEELQGAWVMWRPELYRKVEIVADRECEAAPAETTAAVSTFSGGVDSCFTAWRHRAKLAGPQQCDLRAGLVVHGFDIPLNMQADYNTAAEQVEQMLASIDMKCIRMATNFRELRGHWEDTHGAGLASCLMLLQQGYRQGLIASSYAYSYLVIPYGSNPMTDGMFSSDAFPVIHDGAIFARLEKTRAITQWPAVPKYLRVCWKGPQYDRNCCKCQKCVSVIFHFRLLGLSQMACFPDDITDRQIIWMSYPRTGQINSMKRTIVMAKELNVTDSWVRALKISIFLNQVRMRTPKPIRRLALGLRRLLGPS
jgi:hypothetical protein